MGNGDQSVFGFRFTPIQGMSMAPSAEPNPFGYNLVRPSLIRPPVPSPYTPQEWVDGEAELKLLNSFFHGMRDANKVKYVTPPQGRGGPTYDTLRYLRDRDAFFGSIADYRNYLVTATAELDMDDVRTIGKGAKQRQKIRHDLLRDLVEPNTAVRHGRWRDCQNVYYAWVRKAYEKQLGTGVDIPKLIKASMTPALIAALQQVRNSTHTTLNMGGFNPRPMKIDKQIRLGTLSDHAWGTAIDVDDTRNAQVNANDWACIEAYAGVPATTNVGRLALWNSTPKDLYDAIVLTNDNFVANLAADKIKQPALDLLKKNDKHLKNLKSFSLTEWENGFFTLPWNVVEAFHTAGLTWGATFGDVDLHHFQL